MEVRGEFHAQELHVDEIVERRDQLCVLRRRTEEIAARMPSACCHDRWLNTQSRPCRCIGSAPSDMEASEIQLMLRATT
jgi:hypothetical protein